MKLLSLTMVLFLICSCGGFQAKRVDSKESDKKGLSITDNWMSADTSTSVATIMKKMKAHRGYRKMMARFGGEPKVFIAEVQNQTAEAYFPIGDFNDELLNEISATGDFVLVDEKARKRILEEIKYQNDGMVSSETAKSIGKQTGADVMIFGNVYMKPESRDGKTIKEYSVNIRMTDIERGVELLRTRTKVFKYSEKSKFGW